MYGASFCSSWGETTNFWNANATMANKDLWAKVFFLNGSFAVSVFFVVSGFSLSVGYLERGDPAILVRLAAGRYLRLVVPIFAVCLIVHLLLMLLALVDGIGCEGLGTLPARGGVLALGGQFAGRTRSGQSLAHSVEQGSHVVCRGSGVLQHGRHHRVI